MDVVLPPGDEGLQRRHGDAGDTSIGRAIECILHSDRHGHDRWCPEDLSTRRSLLEPGRNFEDEFRNAGRRETNEESFSRRSEFVAGPYERLFQTPKTGDDRQKIPSDLTPGDLAATQNGVHRCRFFFIEI